MDALGHIKDKDKWKNYYYLLVLAALAYMISFCLWKDIPPGIGGQPRSSTLPVDWQMPQWLFVLYIIAVASLFLCIRWPLIAMVSYIFITWAFAIHKPVWIYTQWSGIQTILVVLGALATFLHFQQKQEKWRIWDDAISKLFILFLSWYILSAVVALLRPGNYTPPLQFSPSSLLEGFLLFSVIKSSAGRRKTMLILSTTVIITLLLRILFFQSGFHKDGDIARCVVIGMPLAWYFCFYFRFWGSYIAAFVVGIACIYFLYSIENRGALIGLVLAIFAVLITSKYRTLIFVTGIVVLIGGFIVFSDSKIASKIPSIPSLQELNGMVKDNKRVITWKAGVKMGVDHWVFGVGPGNFLHSVGDYEPRIALHSAHNIFVDTFAEAGFLGLLLYVALLGTVMGVSWTKAVKIQCAPSRCVFIALAAHLGVGMFLSQTMMALPYLLFAIPVAALFSGPGNKTKEISPTFEDNPS